MECLEPISVPHPYATGAAVRLTVPCGKCMVCLQQKRNHWTFRLMQELKHCISAYFVTLTYDDENLTYGLNENPVLNKRDVQLFMKRIRYELTKFPEKSTFKYFIVGEYGSKTNRPHYHGIFFNLPPTLDIHGFLIKNWKHGHIHIGNVNVKSISYTSKYVIQEIHKNLDSPSNFALMSLRPSIGYDYVETYKDWHRSNKAFYGLLGGKKVSLPRYYKSKIFSTKEIAENMEKYQKVRDELIAEKIKDKPDYFMSQEVYKLQLQNSLKNRTTKNTKL